MKRFANVEGATAFSTNVCLDFIQTCHEYGLCEHEVMECFFRCYVAQGKKVERFRSLPGQASSYSFIVSGEELKKWLPVLDGRVDIFDGDQEIRWGCWNPDRIHSDRDYKIVIWDLDFTEGYQGSKRRKK